MPSPNAGWGVIRGHIHVAALRDIDGITYANCGDRVDSCTAIVEHHDGRLELVEWTQQTEADNDVVVADDLPARSQVQRELERLGQD